MGLTSLPIEAAARAARIFGAALLVVGSLGVVFLLSIADAAKGRVNLLPDLVVVALLYFVPGGSFFFLAARIDAGRRWAVMTSMVLSSLVVAAVHLQTLITGARGDGAGIGARACLDVLLGLPALYLLVRSWGAMSEFRFLRPPAGPPPARGTGN